MLVHINEIIIIIAYFLLQSWAAPCQIAITTNMKSSVGPLSFEIHITKFLKKLTNVHGKSSHKISLCITLALFLKTKVLTFIINILATLNENDAWIFEL